MGTTAPEEPSRGGGLRALWSRRVAVAILVVVVALGAIGLLGVRSRTTEASGNGYQFQLHFASIARPGLTVPWNLEVKHDGGFDGPLSIAVSASYFDAIDVTQMFPQPSTSTASGDTLVWQFDQPRGDTFAVSLQAQVDPSADPGRHEGTASVLDDSGNPVVAVSFRTWLWP